MNFEPSKWDETLSGEMSLENIRELYQPEIHYRVSWNKYPSGTDFDGWSQSRRLYIINGSCLVTIKEQSLNLCAGEFSNLPEGDYHFNVPSDSQVELVSVWLIPE
jgi:hypothetical protein